MATINASIMLQHHRPWPALSGDMFLCKVIEMNEEATEFRLMEISNDNVANSDLSASGRRASPAVESI
jgi:hypothetical protein